LLLTLLPTTAGGVRVTKCRLSTLNQSTSTSQRALNRGWRFTNRNEFCGGVLNKAATILRKMRPCRNVNFGYKKIVFSVTIKIKKSSSCRFGNVQLGFPPCRTTIELATEKDQLTPQLVFFESLWDTSKAWFKVWSLD
jgi:hypothetical protein